MLALAPAAKPERDAGGALVGPVFAATLLELRAAGRDSSPEGLIVLRLAQVIDSGGGTAAGLAAAIREFHASKARALADADRDADIIDVIFGGTP